MNLFLRTFAALLLAAAAGLHAAQAAPEKPHIVFILADDLGYGDLRACNPKSSIPTPHLDRLAAEGMRFTDAHAGGSVCVPSRYSLLTGRFAVRAKLDVRAGPVIEDGRTTIASWLRAQGYATAMVGKWHLGFETLPREAKDLFDYSKPLRGGPVDRGFDLFFGMHASLDIPPYFYIRARTPLLPPAEMVEARTSVGGAEGWNHIQGAFWRAGPVAPDFKHEEVTPRFAAEALSLIRSHAAANPRQPLFLYLALPSPHTPWLPSGKFRGRSGAGMYGDFVMQVDEVVGQVLAGLDEAGMAQTSLVIFSSDNGPVWYDKDREKFGHDSSGGLRGMKASSWEGGHRVPFIVRWPGKVTPGSISARTIAFSDVFATLAEVAAPGQTQRPMPEDSVSFLPWLLDSRKPAASRAPIVHDQWSLREGDWKLILPRRERELGGGGAAQVPGELYNLREDVGEQQNRFADQPERVRQMQAALKAILAN